MSAGFSPRISLNLGQISLVPRPRGRRDVFSPPTWSGNEARASLAGQPLTTPTAGRGESGQIAIWLLYCTISSKAAG